MATEAQTRVLDNLIPIFPNLTREKLSSYVRNPHNQPTPFDEAGLLNRCIDQALQEQQSDIPLVDLVDEASPEPRRVVDTIDLVAPDGNRKPSVIDGGFVGDDDFEGVHSSVKIDKRGNVTSLKRKETSSSVDLPDIPPVKKRHSTTKKVRKSPKKAYAAWNRAQVASSEQEVIAVNLDNSVQDPGNRDLNRKQETVTKDTMNYGYNGGYDHAGVHDPGPYQQQPTHGDRNAVFNDPNTHRVDYNHPQLLPTPAGAMPPPHSPAHHPFGSPGRHPPYSPHRQRHSPGYHNNPSTSSFSPPRHAAAAGYHHHRNQAPYSPQRHHHHHAHEVVHYSPSRRHRGPAAAYEDVVYDAAPPEPQRLAPPLHPQYPAPEPDPPLYGPYLDPHRHPPTQHLDPRFHNEPQVPDVNGPAEEDYMANPQFLDAYRDPVRSVSVEPPLSPPLPISTFEEEEQPAQVVEQNVSEDASDIDQLSRDAATVMDMFPHIEPDFILTTLRSYDARQRVAQTCNYILENPGNCPKKAKPGSSAQSAAPSESPPQAKENVLSRNYYEELESNQPLDYRSQALHLLSQEFNRLTKKDIDMVFEWHNKNYAPTRKCLEDALTAHGVTLVYDGPKASHPNMHVSLCKDRSKLADGILKVETKHVLTNVVSSANMKLLKSMRPRKGVSNFKSLNKTIKNELKFIKEYAKSKAEEKDTAIAESLNEEEYLEEGQGIECGCCFGDCPFEKMVQCMEGHLFCMGCLTSYAREAVFGQGKASLECMSDGCDATYSKSELERSLPSDIMQKYEDRCQEEALNMADMEDLVRCPHCDFAAIIPAGNKVFQCQNKSCMKETCRYCKEDWEEHIGIPCSELEKKDDTKTRLAYEEKMTQAMLRKCHRCKASFTKSDGCNKMTCRCGAKMCYICREPNIDYKHFCQHPREPGKPCAKCTACSLWSDPSEDEKQAIREIQKEAEQERIKQGFTGEKALIGAPEEPALKKKKK